MVVGGRVGCNVSGSLPVCRSALALSQQPGSEHLPQGALGGRGRSRAGRSPTQHPAQRTQDTARAGRRGTLGGCPQPDLAQLSSSDSSRGSSGTCWDLQVRRPPWRVACFLVSTQAGVPAASNPVPAPTRGRGEVEMPRPDVSRSTSCSWLPARVS